MVRRRFELHQEVLFDRVERVQKCRGIEEVLEQTRFEDVVLLLRHCPFVTFVSRRALPQSRDGIPDCLTLDNTFPLSKCKGALRHDGFVHCSEVPPSCLFQAKPLLVEGVDGEEPAVTVPSCLRLFAPRDAPFPNKEGSSRMPQTADAAAAESKQPRPENEQAPEFGTRMLEGGGSQFSRKVAENRNELRGDARRIFGLHIALRHI
mmetsp:Transcript_32453/g.100402  ORF Transcript_32453/g.100402 Transcript_32453/m.100402 type:complete len:206 (-) Transcript_32453:55-672(-)